MDINDIFVSYKSVEQDSTDPFSAVETSEVPLESQAPLVTSDNVAQKITNLKERMASSPVFQGFTSNLSKEKTQTPGEATEEQETEEQNTAGASTKPPTLEPGTWKAELWAAYKRQGCSDTLARNLVGQDALETGWGRSTVGDYNYGNIKAGGSWKGATKSAYDKREGSNDAYRSYNSIDEYAADKVRLIRNKYHVTNEDSPSVFAQKMKQGGYATSPTYVANLIKVIKSV